MSQYYPQPGPSYPPEHNPERNYYYEEGDYEYEDIDEGGGFGSPMLQTGLAFFAGGCLVFLCMSTCALMFAVLWILDPGADTSATPAPGSNIGLSFFDPAYADETVVNEQNGQLTILDVNRNASLANIPPVEGRENIIVTIELLNIGDEDINYNERDFSLLNAFEEQYPPTLGSVEGALDRGVFPPGEGREGRLVFEVLQGEFELTLVWDPGRETQPRYIRLQ